MSSEPILEFEGVSRTYGADHTEVRALHAINLAVVPGELVAVMGPSGSGKSTLLSLAAGLDTPTDGRVLLGNRDLAQTSPPEIAAIRRKLLGLVFQDFHLIPGLTAAENVSLPLELDGIASQDALQQAHETLQRLQLDSSANRFPEAMSFGEQQRVAIARACIGDRRLVLADEPTGFLDTLSGENVMRILRRHCDEGQAALVATHDASHAAFADRVMYLSDGQLRS